MIRVLLQTFRDGRSVYDNYPRTEEELIQLQVPKGYEFSNIIKEEICFIFLRHI